MFGLDLATPYIPPKREVPILPGLDLPPPPILPIHQQEKSPNARIKAAVESLKKHLPLSFKRKLFAWAIIAKKGGSAVYFTTKALLPLVSLFRSTMLGAEKFLHQFAGLMKVANQTRIVSVIILPFSLREFFKNTVGFTLSCMNRKGNEAIERVLGMLDGLSSITDTVSVFLGGLRWYDVLTEGVANLAGTYLVGISSILSLASIGLNAKGWYESFQFKKRLITQFGSPQEANLKAVFKEIDKLSDKELSKKIGVKNGGEVKARVRAIYLRNLNRNENAQSNNLNKAMKTLKNRITFKELGHALLILSAVILIVANAILLFTPLAPVGYALLASASVIAITLLVLNHVADKRFKKVLRELAPDDCMEMFSYQLKKSAAKLEPHIKRVQSFKRAKVEETPLAEPRPSPKKKLSTEEKEKLGDLSYIRDWKPDPTRLTS